MRPAALFVGALIVPSIAAAQLPARCERTSGTSAYAPDPAPGYNHDRFGTLPQDIVLSFGAYVSSFDSDDDDDGDGVGDVRATPEWVAYQIKSFFQNADGSFEPTIGPVDRPNPWYEHPALDFVLTQPGVTESALDRSYTSSGFDRGHLAARAHANRLGWREGCNTHFFLNAVPQTPNFNRGIWRDLENITGAWANKFGGVWVVVGPIFDPSQPVQTIHDPGEAPVAVPSALFKIVARNDPGSALPQVLAFIYPQVDPSYGGTGCSPPYPHERFLVSVRDVQEATGLTFFNNLGLSGTARDNFLDSRPAELWAVQREFFGLTC